MPLYFFDTSALVKRYHFETGSKKVDQILANSEATFVISNITITEFTSAFKKKVNEGIITRTDLSYTLSEFSRDIISEFWIIDLERTHINHSVDLIIKHNIRALDALQLAVLLSMRNASPTLVASDKALIHAATNEGITIINPEI